MKKKISYIFPIYNESGNIGLLYKTMDQLLKSKPEYEYELIFVNDGSKDDSLEKLIKIHKKDSRVRVVDFSRNFGHQIAVTAGLDLASGDAVIIMDSDLQDPPKISFELISKWEEGYDVVYAQRRSRKDSLFKKSTAFLYYWLLQRMAEIEIPRNTGDFRLMDRAVVNSIKLFNERDRFLRGMVSFVGFKQVAVQFDRDERHAGETGYPLKKMLKFASDGIIGFSTYPLKIIRNFGLFISFSAVVGILYAILMKLFYPTYVVDGWAFIVIAVLLVGGAQILMLSVLGSYIGRIFTETKSRPLYIIKKEYGKK
jgi:dolichol-phosphate mannosyltransferase